MNRPPTSRQQAVYDFIREKIVHRGYGPTVREIGEELGIRSPNGVMCHLRALERKQMIRRLANKSRAIELTEVISRQQPVAFPLAGRTTSEVCVIDFDSTESIDLPQLAPSNHRFLIQISGDSLRDQHLLNGDYLVVQKDSDAAPGELVVAETDGGHYRLSRLGTERDQEPATGSSVAIHASSAKRAAIVGVVKGVIRAFA